jgi:hypothetical protein
MRIFRKPFYGSRKIAKRRVEFAIGKTAFFRLELLA